MTISNTPVPLDRPAFERAMAEVLRDHATLRHLANIANREQDLCADIALTMTEVMSSHERTEAMLFELPFIIRTPKTVTATAARARRRCTEFVSGDHTLPDSNIAATEFINALMAHLAAEEAWFDHEKERRKEYLRSAA
jgi:hypothetical protein